jgi:hypothetical protein
MKVLFPLRRWWRIALLPLLLLPLAGSASDGGILDDLPDASVDTGGGNQDNPEGEDGRGPGGTCGSSRDCAMRFGCVQGRCRYVGVREAERVGCLLGPEEGLAGVGLALVGARRRRKREGR